MPRSNIIFGYPLLLAMVLVAAGCSSSPKRRPRPSSASSPNRGAIAELHLFGNPIAMNLDGVPGPDGIGVRVFASTAAKAQGMPISQGTLEILMYDGGLAEEGSIEAKPRKVWTFNTSELRGYMATTSLGTGYQFALAWGNERPTKSRVTVIARLALPKQGIISSDPSSISVTVK